jgi:hypothetical protein
MYLYLIEFSPQHIALYITQFGHFFKEIFHISFERKRPLKKRAYRWKTHKILSKKLFSKEIQIYLKQLMSQI